MKSGGLILNVSPLEKEYAMILYKFAEAIRLCRHFASFCKYNVERTSIVPNENWVQIKIEISQETERAVFISVTSTQFLALCACFGDKWLTENSKFQRGKIEYLVYRW